jgi:TRAP-type transport system periplasmic protein
MAEMKREEPDRFKGGRRMKVTMKQIGILFGVVLTLVMILGVRTSIPQDKVIELRYASHYAISHPFSLADQAFFQKIEKETNGRVKFKPYWNGALVSGRESLRELAKGVADIAFITPIYEKSGVDLTKALLDFFSDSDPAVNAKIFWELYNKFPELRKEYETVKPLVVQSGSPMRLMTLKKPVKRLDDLKAMRIRMTGDVINRTFKQLGADPVVMPVVDMYESLQKGIIQGVIFAHGDYKSLKLAEVIKYETENFFQDRGAYLSRAMNLDAWKKLPPDIQKIFEDNKDWWSVENYRQSLKPDEEGLAAAKKAGIQFVQMDKASLQKFDATFDAENIKEAKELDKKGFPGTKLYEETRKLVKQYNKK